jgi:hypothetical protein
MPEIEEGVDARAPVRSPEQEATDNATNRDFLTIP